MTDPTLPTPAHVELERASHARAALENPLIAEALAAWELEIVESWKTSPLRDAEGREKLRLMLEAAQSFRLHLTRTVETGQLRRIQAERESLAQRALKAMPWGRSA